jgi:hypothetical protein
MRSWRKPCWTLTGNLAKTNKLELGRIPSSDIGPKVIQGSQNPQRRRMQAAEARIAVLESQPTRTLQLDDDAVQQVRESTPGPNPLT